MFCLIVASQLNVDIYFDASGTSILAYTWRSDLLSRSWTARLKKNISIWTGVLKIKGVQYELELLFSFSFITLASVPSRRSGTSVLRRQSPLACAVSHAAIFKVNVALARDNARRKQLAPLRLTWVHVSWWPACARSSVYGKCIFASRDLRAENETIPLILVRSPGRFSQAHELLHVRSLLMGVGKGGLGGFATLAFKIGHFFSKFFAEKVIFLVSSGKIKFHHFWSPYGKNLIGCPCKSALLHHWVVPVHLFLFRCLLIPGCSCPSMPRWQARQGRRRKRLAGQDDQLQPYSGWLDASIAFRLVGCDHCVRYFRKAVVASSSTFATFVSHSVIFGLNVCKHCKQHQRS